MTRGMKTECGEIEFRAAACADREADLQTQQISAQHG
jgi:hypothetical protein